MSGRRGPREFRDFEESQREALQRLGQEIDALADSLDAGIRFVIPRKTEFLDFLAGFGRAHMVNTASGATVNVRLPEPDSRRGGRCCAIVRLNASGTINWLPTESTLNGVSGPSAVSASPGLYVVMFDGGLWHSWRV